MKAIQTHDPKPYIRKLESNQNNLKNITKFDEYKS